LPVITSTTSLPMRSVCSTYAHSYLSNIQFALTVIVPVP